MAKKVKKATVETRKQVRLRERERVQIRRIYMGVGLAAALILIVLGIAYYRTNVALPNEKIASVNGSPILVRDYQGRIHYEANQTVSRLAQIRQQLGQLDQSDPSLAQIANFYQNQFSEEQHRLISLPSTTLETMIDDQLAIQEAKRQGLTVTADEVDKEIELQIKQGLGYARPTPTPTEGPSPTVTLSPTITLTPTSTATPTLQPSATATLSQTLTATPTEGPTETPGPTQTPLSPEAYATEVSKLKENVAKQNYTYEDYRRVIEINLYRKKLNEVLGKAVPTSGEEVHARHILVKTFDEAQKAEARLKAGEDFAKVAAEVSLDTGSKAKGGDLDWFPRGQMVKPFEDAVFGLTVMQVSDPITTTFGVHIIQVLEKDPNHPLDPNTLQQKRAQAISEWLQKTRESPDTHIERFFSPEYVPADVKRLTGLQSDIPVAPQQ